MNDDVNFNIREIKAKVALTWNDITRTDKPDFSSKISDIVNLRSIAEGFKTMRIQLDNETLAKGTLVEAGWYACEIKNYKEEAAKTDRSTNAIGDLVILTGPFKGCSGRFLFNEKAMGFAKNFLKALGAEEKVGADGQKTLAAELNASVNGKKIDVYFVRGTSNRGNDFNDAKDYAKIGTSSGYKG